MNLGHDYYAHPSAVLDDGVEIGSGTKIWHFSHIMSGSRLGQNCNIGQNVVISPGVVLGDNVKVQNNVSVFTGVTCENDVFIGPSVVFTNILNPRSTINRKAEYLVTLVKKGATLGANSTILCGITIAEFAFIGAGSVVTKNVLPYALIYGNPARQKGWMSEVGHKLNFDAQGFAICPGSQAIYILKDNQITKLI